MLGPMGWIRAFTATHSLRGLCLGLIGLVVISCITTPEPETSPVVIWFEDYQEVLEGTATTNSRFQSEMDSILGKGFPEFLELFGMLLVSINGANQLAEKFGD